MLVRRKQQGSALPEGGGISDRVARSLEAVVLHFRADEGIKDGQDVPAIFEHAGENVSELWLALGLSMPFGKNCRRNLNVLAQLLRGMPSQEQTVEKCRFPLRILEIHSDFGRQVGGHGRHRKNAVYRKSFPRQVELGSRCFWLVNTPVSASRDPEPLDRIQSA
jgi:hypothetical protein